MIECVFCYSSSKDNYLFTECCHLVCIDCASAKWDRRFSLKCCEQVTFLSEETSDMLAQMNQAQSKLKSYECRQNDQNLLKVTKSPLSRSRHSYEDLDRSHCKKSRAQDSALVSARESKSRIIVEEEAPKKDEYLCQMENILSLKIAKMKNKYDLQRKQLERKEQIVLKELYNIYTEHLGALKTTCSQADVNLLQDKFSNVMVNSAPGIHDKEEGKQDKILQKLDYNQQKMKEKLHKHYQLLK